MNLSKKVIASFSFAGAFAIVVLPFAVSAACVELSLDLGSGSNDRASAGQVTALQNYLRDAGYLSATPNGNFGPATLAAVKSFQSASGVSATGFVGPMTRAAIKTRSCVAEQPSTPNGSGSTNTSSSGQTGQFQLPTAGMTLDSASNQQIVWKSVSTPRSIILEDADGVSRGFVASNLYDQSYTWRVGSVFSSATQKYEMVESGTYRLRLIDESRGRQANDPVSGSFTIEAKSISIDRVYPTTVAADNAQAMVLFGQGFTGSTLVFVDGNQSKPLKNRYVSEDGRVLVVTVPQTVAQGVRVLGVRSGRVTLSGDFDITVVAP